MALKQSDLLFTLLPSIVGLRIVPAGVIKFDEGTPFNDGGDHSLGTADGRQGRS